MAVLGTISLWLLMVATVTRSQQAEPVPLRSHDWNVKPSFELPFADPLVIERGQGAQIFLRSLVDPVTDYAVVLFNDPGLAAPFFAYDDTLNLISVSQDPEVGDYLIRMTVKFVDN